MMPKVNAATFLLAISGLYSAILLHGRTDAAAQNKEGKMTDVSCGGYYDDVPGTLIHPSTSGSACGYNSNEICTWVISSSRPLAINFSQFNIEEYYDHVTIRDGGSIGSPLIEKLSGKSLQSNFTTAGDAHIMFESDANVVGTGFVLHWRYYSAEEQCRDKNGVCVNTGDRCDTTFDLIENSCDDRCACCVPDDLNPELQLSRKNQGILKNSMYWSDIKWQGPTTNIWSDAECPNLKNDVLNHMEWCLFSCMEDSKCTAVNYNPTSNGCTLRGCPEPVPSPQWHYPPHQGYYMIKPDPCGRTDAYTSYSGHFTSPNYPGNYRNNENCVWVISPKYGKGIILSFMAFNLEKNHDFLFIRDGTTSDSPLLRTLTGDEHNNEDGTFYDFVTYRDHLHITFTSDSNVTKSGFYISWEVASSYQVRHYMAEWFAPLLRFDSKFGDTNKCFPSSAASYYDARASGNNKRICNTNYNTMDGDVPTYWRAWHCWGEMIHIEYWFFFGYRGYLDTCIGGIGSHNSGWEHVVVQIDDILSGGRLGPVQFYQHDGWYTKNPGQYEVEVGDNDLVGAWARHPIVYVGENSHGLYHDEGGSGKCCYWEDSRKPGSKNQFMRTWLNLEELRRLDSAPVFMKDLSSKDKFEVPSPLERPETYELCQLRGCKGSKLETCHSSGCFKSQVDKYTPISGLL